MTPIENLKPGQWIALVNYKGEEVQEHGFFGSVRTTKTFDGRPLKILAINLPFISVQSGPRSASTIDVRMFDVQRLTRKYVESLVHDPEPITKRRVVKKLKPDKGNCPKCGCRLVQRRSIAAWGRGWIIVCPSCGYDQGPVPKEQNP